MKADAVRSIAKILPSGLACMGLAWLASCAEPDAEERARLITYHREEGVRLVGQALGIHPAEDLPVLMEAREHLKKATELAIRPYSACPKCRAAYAKCLTAIGLSHLQLSIAARDEAKRLHLGRDEAAAAREEETRDRERAEAEKFLREANEQYRLYERQDYLSWPLPEVFLDLSANYEILEEYPQSLTYMQRFLAEAGPYVSASVKDRCQRKIEELEEIVRRLEEEEGVPPKVPPSAGGSRSS
ncbi:MAG: hypothetical protein JXP34_03670 [Planctomycetes bacterium]|nr:hypothetical protein [Planctomycetota bacterium]